MIEKRDDNYIRGSGKLPLISRKAENLAEATHDAIIACYREGARVETPKHTLRGSLGYDANMIIEVENPDSEPKICAQAIYDDPRGIMQYILEITHGIHNHWKKNPEHPERWGYTYNERFIGQLPFIFQRIKYDWENKGRVSGRDYQFSLWRAGEDVILEQEDPPCWQSGQLRLLKNDGGNIVLNYETNWRSRDLAKAWNENNLAQIELMKLFQKKISNLLETEIKLGSYIDHSDSLHLYGFYFDRDNFKTTVENMIENGYRSISLEYYLGDREDKERLKRVIAAQLDAENKRLGINLSEAKLKDFDYDIDNFDYPKEWGTWPKEWDTEPDTSKLARVL